jgi:hypothetical protein
MAVEQVNIIVDQGTTFQASVGVTDDAGDLLDLSGYTAAMQMRKSYNSANAHHFDIYVDANTQSGVLHISMPADATQQVEAGRYVYDTEIYNDANTVVTRVMQGIVTVTPGVTRAESEIV